MSISIVPRPASVVRHAGESTLGPGVAIGAQGLAVPLGWQLHDILAGAGLRLPVVTPSDPAAAVRLAIDPGAFDRAEAYRLTVASDSIELIGADPAGLARAVQTMRQLLPVGALRRAPTGSRATLPCCTIEDAPRFAWRGVHIDVARHFMPKAFLLRLIDTAALHRLNVLHLHLTDDQGWRLEVPSRPRLTEVGAWRSETVVGRHGAGPKKYDRTPHGGFYSLDDLREIVAYAAERHVTVVPEVDLPGHVRAALAAYPSLRGREEVVDVARHFGVFPEVLAPTDEAVAFAREVLDVVLDVFPSPFVHLGGDECPTTQWREDPWTVRRAADLGLGSVEQLQSWFLRELAGDLSKAGRRMVGWDEVIENGGMPTETAVMAWRGVPHAHRALEGGHDVIMAPHQFTYFDKYQSHDAGEPLAQPGTITMDDVLGFDPDPAGLPGPGRVLGVQAQLWSEYLPTPRAVQYMALPRICALAEVAWAPAGTVNPDDFMVRLTDHMPRLDALGLEYRPLDGPRPWQRGGTGPRRREPNRAWS